LDVRDFLARVFGESHHVPLAKRAAEIVVITLVWSAALSAELLAGRR
jgi:hypothetical protein